MNHTLVTYLGFVVAVLIITWAVLVLVHRYQRYARPKRQNGLQRATSSMDQWITLKPGGKQRVIEPLAGDDEDLGDTLPGTDAHTRARQNGHSQNGHSQTKYPL